MIDRYAATKRTVRMSGVLPALDTARVIYPRGIFGTIQESKDDGPMVKRIELFANSKKDTYGIIRKLSVAYSSAKELLQIAAASNNVVHVRALPSSKDRRMNNRVRMLEDRLVLKRSEIEEQAHELRAKPPNITVSPSWRERMRLSLGDSLLVSNTIENYAVPPPNL